MKIITRNFLFIFLFAFLTAACSAVAETSSLSNPSSDSAEPADDEVEYRIVTLLMQDAIPAIDDPVFLSVAEADKEYDPDEQVMGVVFNGEARAYSTGVLSRHEIVNDTVGGKKIAVTW